MNANGIAAIFFAGAVCVAPAWGAEAARALAPASGVTEAPPDKCPMHDMRQEAMHKPGEPCPFDEHKGGMPDECKTRAKKDCMEKDGKPCPWPRDAEHKGKMGDECDPAKRSEKPAK
ncbi:MAG TPA: hypothetical protein VFR06_01710 [Gallionellaceae bacterium]|nr:hypothetical protein [Gallionellaceae bacterium]